eukprot:g33715.t1
MREAQEHGCKVQFLKKGCRTLMQAKSQEFRKPRAVALGAARLALAAAPAAPRLGVLAANASGEREAHSHVGGLQPVAGWSRVKSSR